MKFSAGDIVSLVGDDQRMVIVDQLDARLMWVQLADSTTSQMYAFRPADLRLISRAKLGTVRESASSVPQIPRQTAAAADPIAA